MKKLLIIASIAATIFAGCKGKDAKVSVSISDSVAATSAQIAYVNIDSLISRYNMYLDLKATFEEKAKKVNTELTSKGRSFEKDVNDFQEKVNKGLVTRAQAAELEQSLQTKQQTVLQHRDKAMQEMAEEEQVMMNNIQYSITEYLKEFNGDLRYGIIISTTGGGPVLNADPKLDITALVLDGLNKKYDASKKK